MSNRDVSGSEFDPSSFDDVLELVRTWTTQTPLTGSQIVERLRARGVLVRATSSGRHVIVEAPQLHAGDPPEARRFVVPMPGQQMLQWVEHGVDQPPLHPRVIRPPGQTLHRV